jgi:hypothetical protein
MSAAGPVCGIVRNSFEAYRQDALPAPQRKMFRDHLAGCPECRGAAVASDPTFRFARPLADSVSEGERGEILAAVRTGVDLLRAQRRLEKPSRRLRMSSAAAAAVAAVVLLSSGWGVLQSRPAPKAAAVAAAPEKILPPAQDPARASSAEWQPAGLSDGAPSSDATVYDWNPGAGREEPRVVWIVDRGLDI